MGDHWHLQISASYLITIIIIVVVVVIVVTAGGCVVGTRVVGIIVSVFHTSGNT